MGSIQSCSKARRWRTGSVPRRHGATRTATCSSLLGAFGQAESVLDGLGFVRHMAGAELGDRWTHPAWSWSRAGMHVDLHRGLAGAEAEPPEFWATLCDHTDRLRRGRVELVILDRPATACVVALHAAQHGAGVAAPLADLDLALERFPRAVWEDAAQVADRLTAAPAFGAGLRLSRPGAALAAELGLDAAPTVRIALSTASAPGQSFVLEQLAARPGVGAKLEFVRGRLVPPAQWMRAHYPFARRGPAALAAAHAWRFVTAPARLAPALRAWRRARREAAA